MKHLLVIMFGLFSVVTRAQIPQVEAGKIIRFEKFPSQYVDSRNIDVWLPPGYTADKKYPVLYMHDGQMLFDSSITWNRQEWKVDEVMNQLLLTSFVKPAIVVGIWNNGAYRHSEYFPAIPLRYVRASLKDSIVQNELKGKVQADAYLEFIVSELKPFIDSAFSTLTERRSTFIAGSSMGGLISMYAICEYPEVFGGAACLSTHWIGSLQRNDASIPGAFITYLKKRLPSPVNHKIYFDYGTATLDSFYKPWQLKVNEVMKQKGYTSRNWVTKEFPGEPHTEEAWSKRLFIPLNFLLGRVKG